MSTKTKTAQPTLAEVIAQAEADIITQASEAEVALAASEEAQILRQEAADVAELKVADIEASWGSLDETHSAADLTQAEAEHRRAIALAGAQSAKTRTLARSRTNTDKRAAEVAAPVMREALPGVEVYTTFAAVTVDRAVSEAPVVVIRQREAGKVFGDGLITGVVDVTYYRPTWAKEFSAAQVEQIATNSGLGLDVTYVSSGVNGNPDTAHVRLAHGFEAVPVIASISQPAADRWGQAVAQAIAARYTPRGQAVQAKVGGGFEGYRTSVFKPGATVKETETEGLRTATVVVTCAVMCRDSESNPLDANAKSVARQALGTFVPGIGRVTAAEGIVLTAGDGARSVRMTYTLTSRVAVAA